MGPPGEGTSHTLLGVDRVRRAEAAGAGAEEGGQRLLPVQPARFSLETSELNPAERWSLDRRSCQGGERRGLQQHERSVGGSRRGGGSIWAHGRVARLQHCLGWSQGASGLSHSQRCQLE